jgi:hypothetical protein
MLTRKTLLEFLAAVLSAWAFNSEIEAQDSQTQKASTARSVKIPEMSFKIRSFTAGETDGTAGQGITRAQYSGCWRLRRRGSRRPHDSARKEIEQLADDTLDLLRLVIPARKAGRFGIDDAVAEPLAQPTFGVDHLTGSVQRMQVELEHACIAEEEHARALPDLMPESAVNPFFIARRLMALAAAASPARGLVASAAGVIVELG